MSKPNDGNGVDEDDLRRSMQAAGIGQRKIIVEVESGGADYGTEEGRDGREASTVVDARRRSATYESEVVSAPIDGGVFSGSPNAPPGQLRRGVLRYVPSPDLGPEARDGVPDRVDREYILVPTGFLDGGGGGVDGVDEERRGGGVDAGKDLFGAASDKDGTKRAVKKILSALGLKLPNLIVSVAETDGDDIEGEEGGAKLKHCASFDDAEAVQPEQGSKTNRLLVKANSAVISRHTGTDLVENEGAEGTPLRPDVPPKYPMLCSTSRLVRSTIDISREVEGQVLPRAPHRSDEACR